jgi:hypothetical protein
MLEEEAEGWNGRFLPENPAAIFFSYLGISSPLFSAQNLCSAAEKAQ